MKKALFEVSLPVTNLSVHKDTGHLERALQKTRGVTSAKVNLSTGQVQVTFNSRKTDTFALVTAVRALGYDVPTTRQVLSIRGMTCAACAGHVESALTDVIGIMEADVNLVLNQAVVTYASGLIDVTDFETAVSGAGYQLLALETIKS